MAGWLAVHKWNPSKKNLLSLLPFAQDQSSSTPRDEKQMKMKASNEHCTYPDCWISLHQIFISGSQATWLTLIISQAVDARPNLLQKCPQITEERQDNDKYGTNCGGRKKKIKENNKA